MASGKDFVEFVVEQISDCGDVIFKKMFGEYMVYLNYKPIFLICNDTLYVKILPETTAIIGGDSQQGNPYKGAKGHYIVEDVDNRSVMRKLALAIEDVTPLPKKR